MSGCDYNGCQKQAEWLIGTACIPVCVEHHKSWLEMFNYSRLESVICKRIPEQAITAGESMKCPKCGGYLWPGVAGYAHQCPDTPTEMTSLRAIKDKLDETLKILKGNEQWPGLDIRTDNLFTLQATKFQDVLDKLDAIAESKGKLLAGLNDLCGIVNTSNEELCKRIEKNEQLLREMAEAHGFEYYPHIIRKSRPKRKKGKRS